MLRVIIYQKGIQYPKDLSSRKKVIKIMIINTLSPRTHSAKKSKDICQTKKIPQREDLLYKESEKV